MREIYKSRELSTVLSHLSNVRYLLVQSYHMGIFAVTLLYIYNKNKQNWLD